MDTEERSLVPEIAPRGGAVTKRVNGAIAEQRLRDVRKRMLTGTPSTQIAEEYALEWGVTERQVQNYIAKVTHEMAECGKLFRTEAKVAQRRNQLENLYQKAYTDGDLKAATQIMNLLCKIDGAFSPTEHNHTLETREQKEQRLKFLYEQRKKYVDAEFEEVDEGETSDDM